MQEFRSQVGSEFESLEVACFRQQAILLNMKYFFVMSMELLPSSRRRRSRYQNIPNSIPRLDISVEVTS